VELVKRLALPVWSNGSAKKRRRSRLRCKAQSFQLFGKSDRNGHVSAVVDAVFLPARLSPMPVSHTACLLDAGSKKQDTAMAPGLRHFAGSENK